MQPAELCQPGRAGPRAIDQHIHGAASPPTEQRLATEPCPTLNQPGSTGVMTMTNFKTMLLAATALAAIGTAAQAADDEAYVTQNGTGNTANTLQIGDGAGQRVIDIDQNGNSGTANATQEAGSGLVRITIDQSTFGAQAVAARNTANATQRTGSTNSAITIRQSGFGEGGVSNGSLVNVTQGVGSNNQATINQNATLATANVYQEGVNNRAFGTQDEAGRAQYSNLNITQVGVGNNYAEANQRTGTTTATITQSGTGNHIAVSNQNQGSSTLTLVQSGVSNTAYNLQHTGGGNGRTADIGQFGQTGFVNNEQTGSNVSFTARQEVGSVSSEIYNFQGGADNTVRAFQYAGTDNLLSTMQTGVNGLIEAFQTGDSNVAYLSTSGSGGLDQAYVVQNGNSNRVDGSQANVLGGARNFADVAQTGNNNYANYSQSGGGGNTATIRQ